MSSTSVKVCQLTPSYIRTKYARTTQNILSVRVFLRAPGVHGVLWDHQIIPLFLFELGYFGRSFFDIVNIPWFVKKICGSILLCLFVYISPQNIYIIILGYFVFNILGILFREFCIGMYPKNLSLSINFQGELQILIFYFTFFIFK